MNTTWIIVKQNGMAPFTKPISGSKHIIMSYIAMYGEDDILIVKLDSNSDLRVESAYNYIEEVRRGNG